MRRLVICGVIAFFAAGLASANANIVNNGGFETGDFTGWTQTGNTGATGVGTGIDAHSGTYGAFFGPVGSVGGITQTLSTTPGAFYDLNFWLRNDGGTPNSFSVTFDGTFLLTFSDAGAFSYTQYSFPGLLASTGSTALTFLFRQDPAWYRLDDVSVDPYNASATPLPGALPLFATGLGGFGLLS
jgi:Carbohydrate binding domain